MIEVFICEDDVMQRSLYTQHVEDYLEDARLVNMKLKLSTADPNEIISYIKERGANGLYFVDINLGADINGIELASEIRKYDKQGEIIFITTLSDMMPTTFKYKVRALDYIVKNEANDIKEQIVKCMDLVNESFMNPQDSKTFYYQNSRKAVKEKYENIIYFEKIKESHNVAMYTKTGVRQFRASISEIEKKDSCLFLCNHSVVVNMNNVTEFIVKERKICMVDGSVCYVSIRSVKAFKQKLNKANS